jgi:Ca2+-binding EF-hand superfamily protein
LPDVVRLIDADQDGTLNAAEIAAAAERLKSRDADDNDLLFPAELGGVPDVDAMPANLRLPPPDPQPAVLLGPTLTADSLFSALCVRYKVESGPITADRFPAVPALFAALDEDGDGKLQKFEAIRLNEASPQIAIAVDLSATGSGKGLSITSLAAEVAEATKAAGGDALALPGVRITMAAVPSPASAVNYDSFAASYISRLDKDGNAYLEKSEAGNAGGQFELWDGDGDGKVYAKEIAASYAAMNAPQSTRVAANVNYLGSSLFQLLDQNGDGRLGLREMQAAAERIKSLDKDTSGTVAADEIPATISLSFGLGNAGYGVVQRERGAAAGASSSGPEWFQRMDRNLDGDVSLREFLGDEQHFHRLDADGDGLVDPREAEAAAGGK